MSQVQDLMQLPRLMKKSQPIVCSLRLNQILWHKLYLQFTSNMRQTYMSMNSYLTI